MKIIYEFDTLSEDFDRTELEVIQQSYKLAIALSEILSLFRNWTKHDTYPKKQIIKEEDIIYEGQRDYVEDVNAFIAKRPDVIADVHKMREEVIDIIKGAGVDLEML